MHKVLVSTLLSVLVLTGCSDDAQPAADGSATSRPSTAAPSPSSPSAPTPATPEAQAYLDAVQARDAVVARLSASLSDDTLDLPAFQAAGAEYATAVEAFDRALAETAWPADVQPLIDQVRESNVAEVKAARLMEAALDETSAQLAVATVGEARRRGAANDARVRSRLGLPAAG